MIHIMSCYRVLEWLYYELVSGMPYYDVFAQVLKWLLGDVPIVWHAQMYCNPMYYDVTSIDMS